MDDHYIISIKIFLLDLTPRLYQSYTKAYVLGLVYAIKVPVITVGILYSYILRF